MQAPYFKKIVSVPEWEVVSSDIIEVYADDNEKYGHACDLRHSCELIVKSLSHESLLTWSIHVWAYFNGEKWDSIFIGFTRKNEKFGVKVLDEYLWLSKSSNVGMKLYKMAYDFAKAQSCEVITMNVTERHPLSEKVKRVYKLMGFEKDTETYIKRI